MNQYKISSGRNVILPESGIVVVTSVEAKIEFVHLQLFLEGPRLRESQNLFLVGRSNDSVRLREWNLKEKTVPSVQSCC